MKGKNSCEQLYRVVDKILTNGKKHCSNDGDRSTSQKFSCALLLYNSKKAVKNMLITEKKFTDNKERDVIERKAYWKKLIK